MRYKLLGRSGLRVSELCFGTMTFGEEWGWGANKSECRKMFDTFLEAGGNFIDTANRYTEGTSEKFLGEFITESKLREQIVLATKYTLYMKKGEPNSAGNHRKNLVQALDNSLKRLKTDYIDLYWLHAWDYLTPVEEVMRALDDMVRVGKILYIGISDTPAWIVSQANTLAQLRGWTPFVALQIEYSLLERTVERELLPMARAFDMAVTPWGAIGGGVLTGKYSKAGKVESSTKRYEDGTDSSRLSDKSLAIADEVVKVATECGSSPARVALNWVRQQPGLIIPIIGARTAGQLKENLACLDRPLAAEHIERLNKVSEIELGFPHDFLKKEYIRDLVFAHSFDKIDNHRA
ncbi:MAG: aldo/keto reductase [candidate division Zixibacteria bacterium]|nr:aldo/keto reductase [candidate division Zixibacteria bacterium]